MSRALFPISGTTDTSLSPSRRTVIGGLAAGVSTLALNATRPARAQAGKPAIGPGAYKLDLGGYNGPQLTTQPITLRFMRQDFTPAVNALFVDMYARFSAAYPNITIAEERVPYGDLPNKLQVYVASGNAPDIMMGRNDFTPAYHAGKIALPLQDYFTPEYVADIAPKLREASSDGGNLYCMPWESSLGMLYFNRDVFENAGIETPPEITTLEGGWTQDQFIDALERLTKSLRAKGDTQTWALAASSYGNGGPGGNYTQLESVWLRSQGDPNASKNSSAYKTLMGVSDDGLKVSGYVDTPEAILGATNYQKLFTDKLSPPSAIPNHFINGGGAVNFGSLNNATVFNDPARAPKFRWGVSPMPYGKTHFNCNGSDSPLAWAKTPHPAETVALLAFICNDPNRIAFHNNWGSMPARTSLVKQMSQYSLKQPFELASAVADASYPAPRTPGWLDYYNAMNPAMKDIALGADVTQTLHTIAARVDRLLAKYR